MISDELGQRLHNRAALNQSLSAEEEAQLQAWYDAMDRAEAAGTCDPSAAQAETEAQIKDLLAQIAATTTRLQRLHAENEALRRENDELRRRVASFTSPQAA